MEVLKSMRLKKLDLYLHIPQEASEYSAELIQDWMGNIKAPELEKEGSITAATSIAEAISGSQHDDLQWLTLHLSRTGLSDRFQTYLMRTRLQLRRNEFTCDKHCSRWIVRGKMDWHDDCSFEEDLYLEEN